MKKLKLVTRILFTIGAFGLASCSNHDSDFNPNYENELAAQQYKVNFEAKYGKVSANANWDFSNVPTSTDNVEVIEYEQPLLNAGTRAVSSAAVIKNEWEYTSPSALYIANLNGVNTINELAYIRKNAAGLEVKEWTEEQIYGIIDMWLWYVHGFNSEDGYASYTIGLHCIEEGTGSYNAGTEYFTTLFAGSALANAWAYGTGNSYYASRVEAMPNAGYTLGHRVDASALKDTKKFSQVYWYAMVGYSPFTTEDGDNEFRPQWEMKTYKECITPRGAVYWLFDCNHDGDYTDLVFLVEPVEASKRYMVEDLGTTDDFDFNDLVIDVRAYGDRQWAIVRAMGGTLDFTVTIGNTSWSKGESGMNVSTMYNTSGNIDYSAELAVFDVTGWDPDANNISVTVKGKGQSGTPLVIPFPKEGEVPMIIAVNPELQWMNERVSIPADWFTQQ